MAKIPFKTKDELGKERFTIEYNHKLKQVRDLTGKLITDKFPFFDQVNLANGCKKEIKNRKTGEYLTQSQVNNEINKIREVCNQIEARIKDIATLEKLEEIELSKEIIETLVEDNSEDNSKLTNYLAGIFSK